MHTLWARSPFLNVYFMLGMEAAERNFVALSEVWECLVAKTSAQEIDTSN